MLPGREQPYFRWTRSPLTPLLKSIHPALSRATLHPLAKPPVLHLSAFSPAVTSFTHNTGGCSGRAKYLFVSVVYTVGA